MSRQKLFPGSLGCGCWFLATHCAVASDAALQRVVDGVVADVAVAGHQHPRHVPVQRVAAHLPLLSQPGQLHPLNPETVPACIIIHG